ncbi:MAG: DsrE family protein [Nitrospirae bacterium]|nr:DsrE family protein [Nitrospirota bacterium]
MDNLLVILRKPPYGVINAAEAVRHAGGASGFDYKATLYLIDSGVYTARKNQDTGNTGFTGLGESLELLSGEMEIYADRNSLKEYNLNEDNLVEGVKIDDGEILKQAIKDAQSVMIF